MRTSSLFANYPPDVDGDVIDGHVTYGYSFSRFPQKRAGNSYKGRFEGTKELVRDYKRRFTKPQLWASGVQVRVSRFPIDRDELAAMGYMDSIRLRVSAGNYNLFAPDLMGYSTKLIYGILCDVHKDTVLRSEKAKWAAAEILKKDGLMFLTKEDKFKQKLPADRFIAKLMAYGVKARFNAVQAADRKKARFLHRQQA